MLQFGDAEAWDAQTARHWACIAAQRKGGYMNAGVVATAWRVNTDGCPAGVHAAVEYEEQSFARMMEVELPKALAAAAAKTLAGSPDVAVDMISALGRCALRPSLALSFSQRDAPRTECASSPHVCIRATY